MQFHKEEYKVYFYIENWLKITYQDESTFNSVFHYLRDVATLAGFHVVLTDDRS